MFSERWKFYESQTRGMKVLTLQNSEEKNEEKNEDMKVVSYNFGKRIIFFYL